MVFFFATKCISYFDATTNKTKKCCDVIVISAKINTAVILHESFSSLMLHKLLIILTYLLADSSYLCSG